MHLRPDIVDEYERHRTTNDTNTHPPYPKPAPSDVFDIFVSTPPDRGEYAFQAVLTYSTGNTGDLGVDYGIVMLGDVSATVGEALADLLKKTCRRVGERTQGLVSLFEAGEVQRQHDEENKTRRLASDFLDDRNRADRSNGYDHVCEANSSSSGIEQGLTAFNERETQKNNSTGTGCGATHTYKDSVVDHLQNSALNTLSRGRKRGRSPSEPSNSDSPESAHHTTPIPDNDIVPAVEEEEGEYEDSIASYLGPASQWIVARREKRENQQAEVVTLSESLPADIIDSPMLDMAESEAQSNIIYLLTGKRLTIDPSKAFNTNDSRPSLPSSSKRATTAQVQDRRDNSKPAILITPPTPSITTETPTCPQGANTSAFNRPLDNSTILPLTAENLAAVPVAEKLKSPWERQNDEEVVKLRVLQKQMKKIRKYLVNERLMEGQLNAELDA